ncbi:MAG: Ig-like domain-containing protein [Lachnospiraceae bacterium]|nr:Ig-like domain-containing protein [Lachnospiraceae bacterium]
MAAKYIEIEEVPEDLKRKVHQSLAFKTGNFVWRVKFTTPMNPSTVNSTNMYLTSEFGETIKTNIHYDILNNTVEVSPAEPYAEGVSYFLNITTEVQSKGGQKLKAPIKLRFKL